MIRAAGSSAVAANSARSQLVDTGLGLITQSFSPSLFVAGGALSSGQVVANVVGLNAGEAVTGIAFFCSTIPTSPTLVKVGLYSSAGVLLASSADFSASMGTTGYKSVPFSPGAYTVATSGIYYLAYVCVGSNGGSLVRANAAGGFVGGQVITGSGIRPYAQQTSQTDLPSPFVPGDSSAAFWFAAY